MRVDRQLLRQIAVAEDFNPGSPPIGQSGLAQGLDIHPRSVIELVQ